MNTIKKPHPTRKGKFVTHHIPTGFDQVYNDLMKYNEMFSFVLNMRTTMNQYGKLTDKQWAAIAKCLAPKPKVDPLQVLVEDCSIPITIATSSARHIAKVNQWSFNPRTLTVKQIISKSGGGYKLKVAIDWSGNVSECRCCGKALSDWRSQATGVGPYCVKKTGVPYVRNQADVARFQKEMETLAATIGEVEVFIKKWALEQRDTYLLDNAIQTTTPTKIEIKPTGVVIPIQYLDWKPETKTLEAKLGNLINFFDVTRPPQNLGVFNSVTGKTAQFMLRSEIGGVVKYELLDLDVATDVKIILN
jgi:hypothetical protein